MDWSLVKFPALLALWLPLAAVAQQQEKPDAAEKPARPARQVRFLPVGDLPPYQQIIRDGVAYEQDPPPGSIPPREVMIGFGDEKSTAVPLLLGRVTEPLPAPAGEGPMRVGQRGEAPEAEPWLRVNRPEAGDFLVLLWRDPAQGAWDAARSLVLPDTLEAAPAGQARFVNISPLTVGLVIAGERVLLPAGKTYRRSVAVGKDTEFQLAAADAKGTLVRFHSGAIFQNPGERSLIVIYRADGVQPRRPLKAVVHREPVPAAAAPAP